MAVGDWVPCAAWGAANNVAHGGNANFILVSPRDQGATNIGEVGVVETESVVITERVIGWVEIENPENGSDEVSFIERIRVGLLDNAGLAAFFSDEPNSASEGGNEPFLWERRGRIDAGQNNNNVITHPAWSAVDVKVARRIERTQALFYSIWVEDPGETNGLIVTPYLRTWARVGSRPR